MKLIGLTFCWLILSARPMSAADEVNYQKDIKPILTARCVACHGAVRQKGKLRLDASLLIRKGGRNGPALVPGKSGESLLIDAVLGKDRSRMPPEKEGEALTAQQIGVLRAWIDQGGKAPDEPIPEDPRRHWAFQPPRRHAVSEIRNPKSQIRNPIDVFLETERDVKGLVINPAADRATLLRRVYLDLIGLPPTRAELEAARGDPREDWYERIVDRLLASPQYGERWGRHWMDVWRYSDPFGYAAELRYSQQHIWRWRDWIIESLNADRGYDRMVQEMLAGDELAPTDPKTLRATGFLARNWYKFNRNAWMQDTIEHTSLAFLGITMRCARCHDHKYDPISQQDYYRFRAFFEPHDVRIDPLPGQPDIKKDGVPRAFDANPAAPTYLFIRGDDRNPDKSRVLTPAVPAILGGDDLAIHPVRFTPAGGKETTSSGRRLALAQWMTRPDHPLTARVAVNHVWLRHFGKPLVPSVANFGLAGKQPTHPALLDWLAVRFVEDGWSFKKLHRLLVTSETYRLSSTVPKDSRNPSIDPDNRYLWRMNPRRMESEAVRDSLLALAGRLDTTMGGPPVDEKLGLGEARRRSLYFQLSTEHRMLFLDIFDLASTNECYERRESVVPQQALALSNSVLALNQSRLLARSLQAPEDSAFIRAAFEQVLCRPPTAEELTRCERFLAAQRELLKTPAKLTPFPADAAAAIPPAAEPAQRARENLVHVLFNHNDFVTIR
jgi:hypothetical protein